MNRSAPGRSSSFSLRSLARHGVALLILLVAGWILLHFLIGIATALASVLVVIVAVVAVVWALRVLL